MQSCKELWVPRARDGGGPGCPRPPKPTPGGCEFLRGTHPARRQPWLWERHQEHVPAPSVPGFGLSEQPRGSATPAGNPQGQGVKSCCHLCLRPWCWGLSPPTLPGEGKTKSPGPSPGPPRLCGGDDERGELLGLIEGCQDRPDHLGALGFGSFHLRVHIQQVLGPVHGHVVLVVGQAGEDVLQNV